MLFSNRKSAQQDLRKQETGLKEKLNIWDRPETLSGKIIAPTYHMGTNYMARHVPYLSKIVETGAE